LEWTVSCTVSKISFLIYPKGLLGLESWLIIYGGVGIPKDGRSSSFSAARDGI
jgi:hypothetical protein